MTRSTGKRERPPSRATSLLLAIDGCDEGVNVMKQTGGTKSLLPIHALELDEDDHSFTQDPVLSQ